MATRYGAAQDETWLLFEEVYMLIDNDTEWEPRPSSPSSIRLISFGKMLDDKAPLSGMPFFLVLLLALFTSVSVYSDCIFPRLEIQPRRAQCRPHDRQAPRDRRRRRCQRSQGKLQPGTRRKREESPLPLCHFMSGNHMKIRSTTCSAAT